MWKHPKLNLCFSIVGGSRQILWEGAVAVVQFWSQQALRAAIPGYNKTRFGKELQGVFVCPLNYSSIITSCQVLRMTFPSLQEFLTWTNLNQQWNACWPPAVLADWNLAPAACPVTPCRTVGGGLGPGLQKWRERTCVTAEPPCSAKLMRKYG